MRLHLSLILIASLALGVGYLIFASSGYQLSSAYIALLDGDTEEARQLIERAGDSYNRKFLRSCLELSEGNLSLAKFYADQLVAKDSDMPEGQVLLNLIERRSAYPEERWMGAFAFAWRAAGSPKLTLHTLLEEWEWDAGRKKRASIQGTPDELLLPYKFDLVPLDEKIVKICMTNSTPKAPLEIKLLALAWLDDKLNNEFVEISEDLRRRAQKRRIELIQQLSVELPSDIRFAVRAALDFASGDKNFLLTDLDRLEKSVERRRLGPSRTDLYSRYKKRATVLGLLNPQLIALSSVSLMDNDLYWMDLKGKAVATAERASPEVRERLAGILEKVGMAHLQRGTIIDFLYGSDILHFAANVKGDKVGEERAKVFRTFAGELLSAVDALSASLFWPIQSLNLDSVEWIIEDEIGVYQLLTDIELPVEVLEQERKR